MALPVIGATAIGMVIAGIVQALGSRAGQILAGAGLTFIAIKGFETILGFMVADIRTIMGTLQGGAGGGANYSGLAATMMKLAAFAGLFDGINIIISGYMAIMSIKGMKVMLARFTGGRP